MRASSPGRLVLEGAEPLGRADTTSHVVDALHDLGLHREAQEVMVVVAYDGMAYIRAVAVIARGGFNHTHVHVPSVLAAVLTAGCERFLIAHNHPSGDPGLSKTDVALTQRVLTAAETCDLSFEDHIVVTPDGRWDSYAASGRTKLGVNPPVSHRSASR